MPHSLLILDEIINVSHDFLALPFQRQLEDLIHALLAEIGFAQGDTVLTIIYVV